MRLRFLCSVLTITFACTHDVADACHPKSPMAEQAATTPADAANTTTDVSLTVPQAVVLGLVEGATEFLPVSSTGHLVIVQDVMGLRGDAEREKAADSLTICIQGGAILAILLLYWNRIVQIVNGVSGRDRNGLRLLLNLILAFLPAAILGLLAGDEIKERLYDIRVIAAALLTGGILILIESMRSTPAEANAGVEMNDMTARQAVFVGLMQCIAFWPGFSRSYATILGCRVIRMKMSAAVEFSFLLGLATLTAATGYEGLKHGREMLNLYGVLTPSIALTVAFFAAAMSVRFMVASLTRYGLAPFGYYRILLAVVCLWWMNR
ncbi:MAG: undecaprenyl-diphosphate phosphatase [Planctomycetota bacterium]